jgi:hypothetical protein
MFQLPWAWQIALASWQQHRTGRADRQDSGFASYGPGSGAAEHHSGSRLPLYRFIPIYCK